MAEVHPKLKASLESTKASYRRLGDAGLLVSVPIVGCMSFGDKRWMDWVVEEEEALPLLKAAYDRGLTTWDTADVYSSGISEKIIGKALKKYNIPRHRVQILTKCSGLFDEENPDVTFWAGHQDAQTKSKDYINRSGLSRHHILNAVDASLRRLGVDYIDLLQIHRFDYKTPIEETMQALNDVVRSGKVRYIGASSMWTWQFCEMQNVADKHGWTKFVSMQDHYSLLYREEEREMIKYCKKTGVGLIPWGPIASGMLARPVQDATSTTRGKNTIFNPPKNDDIVSRVEEIAKKKGWNMSQVALAWINKRVTSPIVGFSSEKRMDEAVQHGLEELTDEEEKYLEEPYKPIEVRGHY